MKKPFVIGVTGGSGSGKTLFIKKLLNDFSDKEICLIAQDNYYKTRDQQPRDDKGFLNFDLPESIDLTAFLNDVKRLMSGESVTIMEYTYNNPDLPRRNITFLPAPIIIIEGIFVMSYKPLHDLLDLKVFIHAMEHIMLSRRIIRDENERGYDLQDVLYRYKHHVMPSYRKYILPNKEECDIVINNNDNFETGKAVMYSYLKNILE